jgi:hypothetical protein
MVAKQVYMNFVRENEKEKCSLAENDTVYFLDTGLIEFKGVMLPTCEAVFKEEERYKEQYSEELVRLYASIRESLWEQKIFQDMIDLLSKVAGVMPPYTVVPKKPINGMQTITNDSFMQLCRIAMKAYMQDEDYSYAVSLLKEFIYLIDLIPRYDRLILDYLKGVTDKYDLLLKTYESAVDKEIDEKAGQIFSGNYLKTYFAAKNGTAIFEKLLLIGRKSPIVTKKKTLWYNLIKQNQEKMVFTLYSGKK